MLETTTDVNAGVPAAVFLIISWIFVLGRVYVRAYMKKSWGHDDTFLVFSLVRRLCPITLHTLTHLGLLHSRVFICHYRFIIWHWHVPERRSLCLPLSPPTIRFYFENLLHLHMRIPTNFNLLILDTLERLLCVEMHRLDDHYYQFAFRTRRHLRYDIPMLACVLLLGTI